MPIISSSVVWKWPKFTLFFQFLPNIWIQGACQENILIWFDVILTSSRHSAGIHLDITQILNSSSPFHMSHQICKRCFTIFRTRSTIHSSKAYMGTFLKKMGLVCSCVNISSSILTIWSNIAYTSAPPASVGCCGVRGRVSTGTTWPHYTGAAPGLWLWPVSG